MANARLKKPQHGGKREGAGRKPAPRDATLRRHALWYYAADDEAQLINKTLKIDIRREILLQAVVNDQNGVNADTAPAPQRTAKE